jgi:acetyl-CoA carboxylase biotin carboxyl carrier protein
MPKTHDRSERTPAQREADHASLGHLAETLVPALVAKLNASGLGELEVREDDWRIRLRRPGSGPSAASSGRRGDRSRITPHPVERDGRAARDSATPAGAAQADPSLLTEPRSATVTSPAVGVFRIAVAVGTRVRAGDRIGFVDLLGIPQDAVSPIDGTLAELLVAGGDAVEYGEPLAVVEPDEGDPMAPSGSAPAGES